MTAQNTGQQYKITDAVITADRFGDTQIEVTSLIMELNIFENIEIPFLTAGLVLVDDNAIISSIAFSGTERFTFTVYSVETGLNSETSFTHTFIIANIDKIIKTTDKTEVYSFYLIDEHAFKDANILLSKSYNGQLQTIAADIILNELGKSVDASYVLNQPTQGNCRVIIPYMTPLNSAKWLLDRATTKNGSPYFMWASMFDDNIRFGDLDTMISQTPFNSKVPYLYSAAATASTEDTFESEKHFLIRNIEIDEVGNTLFLINEGAIGSDIVVQDISSNRFIHRHHSIKETLDKLESDEIISKETVQNVYDKEHKFLEDGENTIYLADCVSRNYHVLTSYGTYGSKKSYHDSFDGAETLQRIKSNSMHSMLERNKINIEISAVGLYLRKVSVGDTIRINFLNNDSQSDQTDQSTAYDKTKSGDYLITAVRHMLRQRQHTAILTITKLTNQL